IPPLAGPRLMLCCTRHPVNTRTDPSSMRTGKWTVSSRLTSRRPLRASSDKPMTSAAESKRLWAVSKAETRVSTAIRDFDSTRYVGNLGAVFDPPAHLWITWLDENEGDVA